jgi:hypothetical protein
MPFIVKATIDSDVQALANTIAHQMPSVTSAALPQIGYALLALQKQHFDALSNGATSNGVTWPALKPSTLAKRRALQRKGLLATDDPEQIGVLTGRLRKSFAFRVKGSSVRVMSTDPVQGPFGVRRPIFPKSMPPAWEDASERIVQRLIDTFFKPL